MFHSKSCPAVIAVGVMAFTSHAMAQNASSAAASASPAASSSAASAPADMNKPMLRMQLVVSRYEGEKKLGSLPYVFVVTPNMASQMHIRFGVDVPVPSPNFAANGAAPVEYRNMGTNIDCFNVRDLTGGRYQFDFNVQNSAVLPGQDSTKDARPLFRRFDSSFTAVLRDGQSMQTIASTNPVTGEVVKIDVTLNVLR